MPWQFAILGASVLTITGWLVSVKGLVPLVLLPAGTTLATGIGVIRLMKRANRRAQQRIATGVSDEMDLLTSGRPTAHPGRS